MAKKEDEKPPVVPPTPKSDEDEVSELFGITDDEDKHRIKVLAASRVLAARKMKPKEEPKPPETKKKKFSWGED